MHRDDKPPVSRGFSLASLLGGRPAIQYLVDQPVRHGLFGTHEVVAIGVLGDLLDALPRVPGQQLVEMLPDLEHFTGVDVDVGGLALAIAASASPHPSQRDLPR
mgnify:CR=1 FL=1